MVRTADRRREHAQLLRRAERSIDAAVLDAISTWLTAVRFRLIHEIGATVRAAAWPHAPFIVDAAVDATYADWYDQLEGQVLPTISIAFGEAFQQIRRADPNSSYRPQQQYMAEVSDRLRIWPDGAFEEIRPELMEALENAETVDEMEERIGRVLNIDARSRRLRADINQVEEEIARGDGDLSALYRRRRELWEEHDESLNEWQWKARRIARTESHGAVSAGQLAAAQAEQDRTGVRLYKRWLSTEDQRTRATHRVADGQTVPLDGQFRVGGVLLDHPADAVTIAPQEVINCRCTMLIYDDDQLQDELAEQGGHGDVEPGAVRIGTDDADRADEAAALVAEREDRAKPQAGLRGEDLGQDAPQPWEPVELTDEREPLPMPDVRRASDDQLTDYLTRADETDNPELHRAAGDELADRAVKDAERELDAAINSGDPDRINRAADRLDAAESAAARRRSQPADDAPDPEINEADVTAWLDAKAKWERDVDDWIAAEDQWKSDVKKWLRAEELATRMWLAAEESWLDDPLPTLRRKQDRVTSNDPMEVMTEWAADRNATNPLYSTHTSYRVNCQRVVQAMELRRRGYDVSARPNIDGVSTEVFDGEEMYKLQRISPAAFNKAAPQGWTHFARLWRKRDGSTPDWPEKQTASRMSTELGKLPTGARGWVICDWPSGDRHIFSWEILPTFGLRYFDAQPNYNDAKHHLTNAVDGKFSYMRVDDLMPTPEVSDMVEDV